jgi:glucokinase
MSEARLALGLDIGGTKIAGGVIDANGKIVETIKPVSTPSDQARTVAALSDVIGDVQRRYSELDVIGVGAAGIIEWPAGFVRWAPNNSYRALHLRQVLEEASGLPVAVDNDANVAAWAEARLGKSADYMIFLTVGTGIGGGIVLDGRLFRGATGIGAEVGHIIVDPRGGQRCGCGVVGCLEAVASGTALGRYGREAATADPEGLLAALAGGPEKVTGETVYRAAIDGDPMALALYTRLGDWLGIGLASLTTLFDFQLIVIGGGAATIGDPLFEPTRKSLRRNLFAAEHRLVPEIVPATLGIEAGWVGAAVLALDETSTRNSTPRQVDRTLELPVIASDEVERA